MTLSYNYIPKNISFDDLNKVLPSINASLEGRAVIYATQSNSFTVFSNEYDGLSKGYHGLLKADNEVLSLLARVTELESSHKVLEERCRVLTEAVVTSNEVTVHLIGRVDQLFAYLNNERLVVRAPVQSEIPIKKRRLETCPKIYKRTYGAHKAGDVCGENVIGDKVFCLTHSQH